MTNPAPYVPPSVLSSVPTAVWNGVDGLPVMPYLPGQSMSFLKSPLWATKVKRASSGRERRTQQWTYPLWQFQVDYEILKQSLAPQPLSGTSVGSLWEFYNWASGQAAPWLFLDPTDYYVGANPPITALTDSAGNVITDSAGNPIMPDQTAGSSAVQFGVGDGVTTTFPLVRAINSWTEPVYAAYAPAVYDNGTLLTGAQRTYSKGQIQFTTAPLAGHTLSWTGYFYYGCRFDQDDLKLSQFTAFHWSNSALKFTSLRR